MDDQEKLRILARAARAGDSEAVEWLIGWVEDLIEFQPPVDDTLRRGRPSGAQNLQIFRLGLDVCRDHLRVNGTIDARKLAADIVLKAEIEGYPVNERAVRRYLKTEKDYVMGVALQDWKKEKRT